MLGFVPMPDVSDGQHLIDVLYQVGPVNGDRPLVEADLEAWERRRGIALDPWQADAVVAMSRAFLAEMHAASKLGARPAWQPAEKVWLYVTEKKNAPAKVGTEKK